MIKANGTGIISWRIKVKKTHSRKRKDILNIKTYKKNQVAFKQENVRTNNPLNLLDLCF